MTARGKAQSVLLNLNSASECQWDRYHRVVLFTSFVFNPVVIQPFAPSNSNIMADDWGAAAIAQEQRSVTGLADQVSGLSVSSSGREKAVSKESVAAKDSGAVATKDKDGSSEKSDKQAQASVMQSFLNKQLKDKLVHTVTAQTLEVQHADPNSPLYSVKSFEELHLKPNLLKGVYEMGFSKPSKIQETALPILLADPPQNMIAQSQSGTGKTAAFVLTVLSRVDGSKKYPQALLVAPTFELAHQIADTCRKMAKYCDDLSIALAVRGEKPSGRLQQQVVIGTPGTVIDWLLKKRVFDAKKILVFVLDEADVMISLQGHQDQSIRLHKMLKPDCQTLFFSATYDDPIIQFAHKIVTKPTSITLKREQESLENIRQIYIMCTGEDQKYEALSNIYSTVSIGQSVVFCHSRKSAAWLAKQMTEDGHAVAMLTGELDIAQRLSILNRFRQGLEKLLITTNVCSRGLDIEQVTVVVNYDVPINHTTKKPDFDTYLHRIGRTGRFGKSGLAINLVDSQRSLQQVREIEQHFGRKIEKISAFNIEEVESLGEWRWESSLVYVSNHVFLYYSHFSIEILLNSTYGFCRSGINVVKGRYGVPKTQNNLKRVKLGKSMVMC